MRQFVKNTGAFTYFYKFTTLINNNIMIFNYMYDAYLYFILKHNKYYDIYTSIYDVLTEVLKF